MLKIEISGRDVGELYANSVNLTLLLARGGEALFKPQPVAESDNQTAPVDVKPEAVAEPNPPVVDKPAKAKRTKPAQTIEATANADDALGLSDAKPAAKEKAKALTLDDMRDRVKAIIKAHEGRGNDMPKCVAYVRQLFEPFGIKLAAELKPEQFDEFMAKSQAYLDGTAK
jgi:hypothetical protein